MVYRCGDGAGNAIVGIAFMLGAGLIGLLCLLGIVGVIGNAGIGAVVALPVCALVAFVGWRQTRGFPHQVVLDADGTIRFVMALGRSSVRVSDVIALELTRTVVAAGEDLDPRLLAVRHRRGVVRVPWFPEIDRLIADIRRLNPAVAVTGHWDVR